MGKSAPPGAGGSARRRKAGGRPFVHGNEYRWKPGQSGNPAGMPKSQHEARKFVEDRIRERIASLTDTALIQAIGYAEDATSEQVAAIRQGLALGKLKGNALILIELLNRAAGKVAQPLEHSGPGGAPLGFPKPPDSLEALSDQEVEQLDQAQKTIKRLAAKAEAAKSEQKQEQQSQPNPSSIERT